MSNAPKAPVGQDTAKPSVGRLSRARGPLVQRDCSCAPGKPQCDSCQKKEKETTMQRSARGASGPVSAPPSVSRTLATPGRPLESGARSFMEPRFNRDFSDVRVHTDSGAAASARAVSANAYTVGQHIVFDEGQYDPGSHSGKQLLAHELAHTIQQHGLQRSSGSPGLSISSETDPLEREAATAARSIMQGRTPSISSASGPEAQRLHRSPWGVCPEGERESATPEAINQSAELKALEYYLSLAQDPRNVLSNKNFPEDLVAQAPRKHKQMLEAIVGDFRTARRTPPRFQPPLVQAPPGEIQRPGRDLSDADEGAAAEESPVAAVEGKSVARDESNKLLRPDIADLDSREVYDVTTIGQADAKVSKIANDYVAKLERLRQEVDPNSKPWKAGSKLPPPPKHVLVFRYQADHAVCFGLTDFALRPGVIVYEAIKLGPGGAAPAATEPYEIATNKSKYVLDANPSPSATDLLNSGPNNLAAATAIDGLVMKTLKRPTKGGDTITACVLSEGCLQGKGKPAVPITILSNEGNVELKVDKATRALKLAKSYTGVKFKSKYLSEGVFSKLDFTPEAGLSAKGTLTPSIPLLNRLKLGVEVTPDSFTITSGLDEDSLKKISTPFPGAEITKAALELQIFPEFKPSGKVDFRVGSAQRPLANAHLEITKDSDALLATGKINFDIPKLKTAETNITYRAGGGKSEWNVELHIKSEDIKLGPSISVSGGFDGIVDSTGFNFSGQIDATFPGNNTATLGLKKKGEDWTLFGEGTFHFPKLDETKVRIDYHLGKDVLTATGRTGFKIESLNLGGRLDPVTFIIEKGGEPKVHGTGKLRIERGKVKGDATVTLHPNGKFSGKGTVSYKLRDNIIVTGTVELNEHEKLRLTGELLVTRYEIFKQYGDKKDLFTVDFPVPVPGLSIGTSGLVFHIRGGVGVAYSFGPGVLEPLKFSAGFDPLEADPNLELAVTGSLKIPASASLSAFIEGTLAVQVDVYVGSAGAEGGLRLTGELRLDAGAFADFNAAYKNRHLTAKLTAGIDTKLLLGISLTAFVHAWAGAFGFKAETRKDWTLAKKVIDTGIGFYISAPFEYADDTGVKLPEFKDITLKKPDVTKDNMKRILGEIFGSSSEKTTEK